MQTARHQYGERAATLSATLARLERAMATWAWIRVVASIAVLVALYLSTEHGLAPWSVAIPAAVMLTAYAERMRLRPRMTATARALAYHRRALARLDGNWVGLGPTGDDHADEAHPYAYELDVVGRGSMFDYLCTAGTRIGQRTLARWLLAPASADEIRRRQRAVDELRTRLELREDLAAAGSDADEEDPDALARWAEARGALPARPLLWVARAVAVGTIAAAVASAALGWSPVFVATGVVVSAGLTGLLRARLGAVFADVVDAHRQLALVARVAERLAREPLESEFGASLRAALAAPPAAHAVARLGRLAAMTALFRNELVAPFAYALCAPAQLGAAMALWRARHGPSVRLWTEAIGQLEALVALAGHAFENPDHAFPEIVDGPARFDADALCHPLLPAARCIRNDVHLGGSAPALLLLSGSNMSGKSTLLRAVGLAAVLGFAGAPVRSRRLVLAPMAIGATIRVRDSVLDGVSRFMSEITRLRRIVALAETGAPVLFILDEILGGTNSEDRRQGARGLLAGLLDRGAIGMCTTHDLALTELPDKIGGRAANAHLSERFRDGKLEFDYVLRPGVVRESNALELMRAVGLRV